MSLYTKLTRCFCSYVFFVFWDLFEMAFIYLFFVETKGRALEEMDAVFAAKNPRKASTQRKAADLSLFAN